MASVKNFHPGRPRRLSANQPATPDYTLDSEEPAILMHYSEIARRACKEIPAGASAVVYCWSPGCNAGAKGALEFARLGFEVSEMIVGFEYWVREGYPVEDHDCTPRRPVRRSACADQGVTDRRMAFRE